MNTTGTSVFLRWDGSLLLARGEAAIECRLTPEQLMQLGVDALRTAVALEPRLLEAALQALETTYVLPIEAAPWSATLN